MFPPSDRCKPIVEALLAYPDAGTEADHLEVFRGVAQIVRSTVGDRQQLGDLLHPVNERSASRWFCKFYCSKAVIVGLIIWNRAEISCFATDTID